MVRGAVRSWVYDRAIAGLTAEWYRAVLERVPPGADVLDVGIGTGSGIVRCADLVRERDLHIVGLDIDRDYFELCASAIARAGLAEHVVPCLCSVYDHEGGPYDVAYFSASLMLLTDPVEAMRHVAKQLAPGGRVYFTQTFHHHRSGMVEKVKPMLGRVTTIEFGRVTYEDEFRAAVDDAGLELVDFVTLKSTRSASARLAVAQLPPPV